MVRVGGDKWEREGKGRGERYRAITQLLCLIFSHIMLRMYIIIEYIDAIKNVLKCCFLLACLVNIK